MKNLIFPITFFICTNTMANMTSASLFKDAMSTNPGTISQRSAATFSLRGQQDVIEIDQDLSNGLLGAGSTYKGKVNINNARAFYGGKGGGLTTEVLFEQGSGGRTDTLKSSAETTEYDTESTVTNLNVNIGIFEGFGLGLTQIAVTDKSSFTGVFNGDPLTIDNNFKHNLSALSAGVTFNLGLDFGLFYQKATLNSELNIQGQSSKTESNEDRAGFGLGYSTKGFRLEAGYVRNLEEKNNGIEDVNPAMAEFSAELSFGKMRIGYTGRYFMDGFFLFSGVIYDVLAYNGDFEDRLENAINFALGDDTKGHSISASLSTSKVDSEKIQLLVDDSGTKYKTTTEAQAISVSYSYTF